MNESVTIEIPVPHACLRKNSSRGFHWTAISMEVRRQRDSAHMRFLEQMGGKKFGWEKAVATVKWITKYNRKRDAMNIPGMLPGVWDGAQDAGLVTDDVGILGMESTIVVDRDMDPADQRVEITITQKD